ncbi:MAG: lipopolysaccharide core heptose(II) kinase RfaY [Halodesulfurarchaeum sp.]
MSVRQFVRGQIPWPRLEDVGRELARRYDQERVRITFFDADNWLSTPCVVNDRWFVKIISPQNALVHALFTGARNLGAFSSGTEGFFERFDDPVEMARHELEATKRMHEIGLHAPDPVEAFEVEGLGVLVLEYLDGVTPLNQLSADTVEELVPSLFEALATMHDHDLVHGDFREENVLVRGGELYFIDATAVDEGAIAEARAYDLASALAALEPHVGAKVAVRGAAEYYPASVLLEAVDFLDFVNIRPDHDFDAAAVKGEVSTLAAES